MIYTEYVSNYAFATCYHSKECIWWRIHMDEYLVTVAYDTKDHKMMIGWREYINSNSLFSLEERPKFHKLQPGWKPSTTRLSLRLFLFSKMSFHLLCGVNASCLTTSGTRLYEREIRSILGTAVSSTRVWYSHLKREQLVSTSAYQVFLWLVDNDRSDEMRHILPQVTTGYGR